MRKFGVKLWSDDVVVHADFAVQCVEGIRNGDFDYLELFALPDSYEKTSEQWKKLLNGIEVIVHAPHSRFGLDTGNAEAYEDNVRRLDSSFRFADMLKSDIVIVHAGMGEGEKFVDETIRQFKRFDDKRIAVENLPYYCTSTGNILHGTSPDEIRRIKEETGCQFCFDFSHAVCAANHYKRDVKGDLAAYYALKPDMYHMCDGLTDETEDKHLHYGKGNYNLAEMLNVYTAKDAVITMETGKGIPSSTQEWLDDVRYLKSLEKN